MQMIPNSCFIDTESSNFSPLSGRLIVIGLKDTTNKDSYVFHDDEETILIKSFLAFYNEKEYTTMIGYNLKHDTRYIFAKCLKYKIPAGRFFQSTQIDLMEYMKGNAFNRPGKFQEWMTSLGRPSPRHPSIRDLYNQGKLDAIIDHNERDLESLDILWNRINLVLNKTIEGGAQ